MDRRVAVALFPPLVLVALALAWPGRGVPRPLVTARVARPTLPPPGPEHPVRFVAVGDTGTGGALAFQVAARMGAWCEERGCDFAVLLGDNIYPDGAASADDPIWTTHVDRVFAPVRAPLLAILGNHDYGGRGAGFERERGMAQIRRSDVAAHWYMEAPYWHLVAGDVELLLLDTQAQLFRSDEAQQAAVDGWLVASRARWRIALGHHPYLSNGTHGDAGNYAGFAFLPLAGGMGVRDFLEEHICGRVDLYLSAHDHSRQFLTETCRGTELAISGAGAKPTAIRDRHPARFASSEPGFVDVRTDGGRLVVSFVDVEGRVNFQREVVGRR